MAAQFNLKDILMVTRGRLLQGEKEAAVKDVSIDTRRLKKGSLFIAIKGERFDGHDFINTAVRKGAEALIVSKRPKFVRSNIPIIYVKDTTKALGQIAGLYRSQFKIPVIAITGSTGKTTTKEMLAAILGVQFNVLKNVATQNNHIGVPLTLLNLNKDHDIIVLEFGTNQFGDISWLTKVAQPNIAVYTNIGESHLHMLKTAQGVLREKWQLVRYMPKEHLVVLNVDDSHLSKKVSTLNKKRVITFGTLKRADYQISDLKVFGAQKMSFKVNGRSNVVLQSPVKHNAYNAIAAISCGRLFKIRYNDINRVLGRFKFPKGRQEIRRFRYGWLIDDSYNANPLSFKSAVDTLSSLPTKGRKVVVCADMLELGHKARKCHSDLGKAIASSDIDLVLTFGSLAQHVSSAVNKNNNGAKAYHCPSIKVLHKRIKDFYQTGDAILVKGSRSMHLERTIEFLNKSLK